MVKISSLHDLEYYVSL